MIGRRALRRANGNILRTPALAILLAVGILPSPARAQTSRPAPSDKPCDRSILLTGHVLGEDLEKFLHRTRKPTPWLDVGGDFRLREDWMTNAMTLSKRVSGHELHLQRYRLRVWGTAQAGKDVSVNARLVYGPWHFDKSSSQPTWRFNEAVFDKLNVRWKNVFGLPVAATVGRQDMMFGDGWLVTDGTPLDASRTICFDAARLTFDLKNLKTTVDAVYVDQRAQSDARIKPFGDDDELLAEEDSRGVIVYAKHLPRPGLQVDGYYIFKHDRAIPGIRGAQDADVPTVGARVAGDIGKHWKYRAEAAGQFGEVNGQDLLAFGADSRLTYLFGDRWANSLRLEYEYASGDRPGSGGTDEQFQRLWGRWPRLGSLILYPFGMETRLGEMTNLHRVGACFSCRPAKPIDLCFNYNALFADTNAARGRAGFSRQGGFRGQLLTGLMKYRFNQHVSGNLTGEVFFPGNYYDNSRNDPAVFLRFEIVFSW